jgi:Zn-dependent peptidase ImmA (M78 family)
MKSKLAPSPLSKDQIIHLANGYVERYRDIKGWAHPGQMIIDIHDMYENIFYPDHEYKLITSVNLGFQGNNKVLGKTISTRKEKAVLIDSTISPPKADPRYVFTLGHEFGHSILHPKQKVSFKCSSDEVFIKPHPPTDDAGIIEFQANCFAEHLLMPEQLVRLHFDNCFKPKGLFRYFRAGEYGFGNWGGYRKRHVGSYTEFCIELARPIRHYFSNVSVSSLALRLHKLNLVANFSNEQIFDESTLIAHVLKGWIR